MVHVPLMFLSEWREFPSAPSLAGKITDDSSRLDVVEIARVAWQASFHSPQQEKTCNAAHEQTPLSNDTIDSVLRHGEVGRAKDLSGPPRVCMCVCLYIYIYDNVALLYSIFIETGLLLQLGSTVDYLWYLRKLSMQIVSTTCIVTFSYGTLKSFPRCVTKLSLAVVHLSSPWEVLVTFRPLWLSGVHSGQ